MKRSFSDWRAQSARQAVPAADDAVTDLPGAHAPAPDAPIAAAAQRDSFPLSFTQERIWFVNQLDPLKPIYVCPHPVRLRGALKPAALEAALSAIVARHEPLRTRFAMHGQHLRQQVLPARRRLIPLVDLSHLHADQAWRTATALAQSDTLRPFDLRNAPSLLRVALIRLAADDHVLLFTLHHLIGDDWSMAVLIEEMAQCYAQCVLGLPSSPSPPSLQYGDYAQWQRDMADDGRQEERRRYWHDKLRGVPVLNLATDRNRGTVQSHSGHKVFAQLPPPVMGGLKALCNQVGTTPFVIVLALFKLIFQRYSNQDDIAIGVPVAGRARPELQRMVGPVLNMLVMRSTIDARMRFADFLKDVRNTVVDAFEHQDVPFEKLVEDLQPARDLSHAPLCQAIIAYHYDSLPRSSFADLAGEPIALSRAPVVFDLDITATEHENTLWFSVTYDTQLFDESTVRQMMTEYSLAAAAVAADPSITLTRLRAECARACAGPLALWNAAPPVDVAQRDLGSLFLDAAVARPDAVALIAAQGRVTYAALRRRALHIAGRLRAAGVGPERVVGSAIARSCESVAALLGILIAGGAYAYIDPHYPDKRIRELLDLTDIRVLLATAAEAPRFASFDVQVVVVDGDEHHDPQPLLRPRLHPDNSACVVFTSGSQGIPKAVISPHRGLLNRLQWMWDTQPYRDGEILAHRVSLNFVDCICEAVGPLLQGRPLAIVDERAGHDVAELLRTLAQEQVGRLVLIPSLLATLLTLDPDLGASLPALRHWVCSGEPLDADLVRRFRDSVPGARIYNFYGSSEVAADVTAVDVTDTVAPHGGVPLGRPIHNTRAALVDDLGFPVPPIVAGEMVIAGDGLARGYSRLPAATADRFRPSPLGGAPGERVYMTGDMARLSLDAECSFVGRRDQQIKIHGRRIELGEIESAMLAHARVTQAAALAASDGHLLVGFYSSDSGLGEQELLGSLRTRLPQFMLPSQLIRMQRLPSLATGKLDRKALSALHPLHPLDTPDAQPSTPLEKQLADIWRRVLNLDTVGARADFFSLGGHSMAALQMLFLIDKELQRKLDIAALFQNPTVAALASHIGTLAAEPVDESTSVEAIPDPASRGQPFPLTDLQQAYWVGRTDAFRFGQVSIHAYFEVEAEGLDLGRFTRVWNTLVHRHDMLRAVVTPDGQQKILAEVPDYRIDVIDLRDLDEYDAGQRLSALRDELSHQVLPLERWPGFDVRATVRDSDRIRLHVSIDTFFLDGWSQRLLFGELVALYDDPDAVLDPPQLQLSFRDWFLAARELAATPAYARSMAVWTERIGKLAPAPELPVLHRPGQGATAKVRNLNAQLDAAATRRLRERAHALGRSIVDVALAGYVRIVSAWSANARFTLNIPTFSRMQLHAQTNRVVGPFSSFTIGEFDGSAAGNFADLLAQAHIQLRFGAEHQLVSGIELMRELRRTHGFAYYLPVVFTSLIFDADAAAVDFVSRPSTLRSVYACGQTPQVWLDNRVDLLTGGVLSLGWDVPDGVFPEGLADDMFDAYVGYLRAMADKDWNAGDSLEIPYQRIEAADPPCSDGLLHTDFVLQARATPQADAVRCGATRLSYAELHGLAQHLSAQLRAAGARRNGLVAVVMEKGWEQVAAVLGVVLSGAAYLPLDARWPAERLQQLLDEAQATVVLTQARVLQYWRAPPGLHTICVDQQRGRVPAALPATAGEPAQPDDLAYVIYTSGSTGRPKGVMITHRAALNTVRDVNERFGVTAADRVLGLSSMSFDLSVYDVFGTLAVGAC
ncbi:amino acid adenylation domain-containing protein, partial [Xanthomonas hortorum pv. hederae]